ncbi:MAG: methylenetetrahydrofolate reductase C-terminal domain-containing protein [Clostridiales bacterium]|jgi:ferredoxin|nr:methylenetetrahydrofolate reductase C-terminal domain-containing protein [Clostridiales bacterium]
MIIADQKPLDEVLGYLKDYKNIAIAACGTCVTICLAGGLAEAENLAEALRIARGASGRPASVRVFSLKRQCDAEFIEEADLELRWADAILSTACGVGVQFMAERFQVVLPGLNTTFFGASRDAGLWTEMCQGCGNCVLERTGGICPVTRCSKSNFNGPCGGSSKGKCEIDSETDCGWQLIYEKLKSLGKLERLYEIQEIKDWRSARDGGPRKRVAPLSCADELAVEQNAVDWT